MQKENGLLNKLCLEEAVHLEQSFAIKFKSSKQFNLSTKCSFQNVHTFDWKVI